MKVFSIYAKKEFEKDGENKIRLYRVGIMKTTERGNSYLTLFQNPDVQYCVFETDEILPEII